MGLTLAVLIQTGCGKEYPESSRRTGDAGFELFASHSDELSLSGSSSGKTRTVNDGLATKWTEGDAISVSHSPSGTTDCISDGEFSLVDADAGRFSGSLSGTLEEGSTYDWYALYPYSDGGVVTIGGDSQTQTGNDSKAHLAGAVCPLYGIAENVAAGTSPSVTMKNLSTVVKIVVENNSGSDLTVESVSFTAPEDIVGQYDIDFISSSSVEYIPCSESEVSKKVVLTVSGAAAVPSGSSASFYLVMKPFTASAGSTVDIAVNGFVKSVTLGADLTFAAGNISRPLHFNYNAGADILPGRDIVALRNASKWYVNEYRAGFGLDAGEYGNNTTFLMAAQFPDWYGRWEYQNEGCTLRIVDGDADDSSKTADLTKFNSYTYGLKKITEDNRILSVYSRIHHSSRHSDDSAPWGVMVVDLNQPAPAAVPVKVLDGDATIVNGTSTDYTDTWFDLGDYVGKEVIVAIGLYRQYSGYCDYQLPLAHISFGPAKVYGHKPLATYGTEVTGLEGWKLSLEELRSIMPNTRKVFNGNKGSLVWSASPWFSVWAGTGHIASEWGLQVVRQNYCTSDCGEGFMLDTRNLAQDFSTPVSYLYSKFNIDSEHDKMSFYTRNFSSSVYTYFKITVIEADGTVSHLSPSEYTATAAEAADNGCWKFIHESGWSGDLTKCARFDYDLSAFSGKDVVICIGLYSNGADEQKLVFCSVNFE